LLHQPHAQYIKDVSPTGSGTGVPVFRENKMPVLKAVANDKLYMLHVPFVLDWYQQRSYHLANHNLPLAVAVGNTS